MDPYTVLARKYRPNSFSELVGQEHVARTLSNAIASGRVAHAFLFTGVRGVGKTTSARILAKALNCETGPTATPCNTCEICESITQGTDMDVQEIDGASNNGVDDVRRLQETLPFRPARDRFKIVIVDEVHMLSTGAFNAFLKTLEEPPDHVKFIFATTESHKVPVTIRSRCQRYDFRLIPQRVIAARLREILKAEEVVADDEAIAIAAREAAGSMRDALTVLDQLIAFSGKELVGAEVAKTLGIAGRKHVFDTAHALLSGDAPAVLQAVQALANEGSDMLHFSRQLLELTRDFVVLSVAGSDGEDELLELVDEERAQAGEIVSATEPAELQRAFSALSKLVDEVAAAGAPKMTLEMGLVRIASRPPLRSIQELLARLQALEERMRVSGSARGRDAGDGGTSRPKMTSRTRAGSGSAAGSAAGSGGSRSRAPRSANVAAPAEGGAASDEPPPWEGLLSEPSASELAPAASATSAKGPSVPEPAPESDLPTSNVVPVEEAKSLSSGQADHANASPSPDATRGPIPSAWQDLVDDLRATRPALSAILEHGVPMVVTAERLVIGFSEDSFFAQQADTAEAKQELANAAAEIFGSAPAIEIATGDMGDQPTLAQVAKVQRAEARRDRRKKALNHPGVQTAMRVFPEAASQVEVHLEGDH